MENKKKLTKHTLINSIDDNRATNLDNNTLNNDSYSNNINTDKEYMKLNTEFKKSNFNENILNSIDINSNDNHLNNEIETNLKEDTLNNLYIKNNKHNLRFYATILSAISVGVSSYIGTEIGSYIRNEEERIESIDLENIDLQLIVDTTDNIGKDIYQLNWKEIFALLSVFNNNYNNNITKDSIIEVGNLFLDNSRVKSFNEVVENLELSNIKKERAYKYLNDLEHYGFTPNRLNPDGEQMKFINSIKKSAINNYYDSNILPSITIAQAILESNWGKSSLAIEANNLFGIKADKSWKGDYAIFDTKEYHDTFIKDKFRKYDSLEESIKDHSVFLMQHKRYKEHNVFSAKTYKQQALALENAGYSTAQDEKGNKTYAKMLTEIIRQYNLQIIDASVLNK